MRIELQTGQTVEIKADDYDEEMPKAICRWITDNRAEGHRSATFTLEDDGERYIEAAGDSTDILFHSAKGTFEYSRSKMMGYLFWGAKSNRPLAVTLIES